MVERSERLAELLHDAILIAEQARDDGLLRHLHDAWLALRDWRQSNVPLQVDILAGRVFSRGLPVAFAPAELAVVIALALTDRGLSRDLLAEDLYPHAEPGSALNALKVNVHRIRRRTGLPGIIRYDTGRYALGSMVEVELPRLEAEFRRLQTTQWLDTESRSWLERLRQRVLDGRPTFMLEWPWFDETEQRLRDLGHDLTTFLAYDALRGENYQHALVLATELTQADRLDEDAAEIAIRAFLQAGNRTAAIIEYRRYASLRQREGEPRPSDDLRALVEQP